MSPESRMPKSEPTRVREMITDILPTANLDAPLTKLMAISESGDAIVYPLVKQGTVLPESTARSWQFIVPTKSGLQLNSVQFDVNQAGSVQYRNRAAAVKYESDFIDEVSTAYRRESAVRSLFKIIGGDVTRTLRDAGELYFAGIERRVATSQDDPRNWSQLMYPRRLLDTHLFVQRDLIRRRVSGQPTEGWMRLAANQEYRHVTARLMALSALAAPLNGQPAVRS